MGTVDNLLNLPEEILMNILIFLNSEELSALLAPTCRYLAQLCNYESIWKRLCLLDFGSTQLPAESECKTSWKQWYIYLDSQLEFNKELSAPKLEIMGNCVRSSSFADKVGIATPKGFYHRGHRSCRYFEVIVDAVLGVSEFGIGVATADVPIHQCLGFDSNSWGLFSLTSSSTWACHGGRKTSLEYSTPLEEGDIVGVLLNLTQRTLSFSVNGNQCGVVFRDLPDVPLFPAVSLRFIGAVLSIINPPRLEVEEVVKSKKRKLDENYDNGEKRYKLNIDLDNWD